MFRVYKAKVTYPQTGWQRYLPYEDEPKPSRGYDMSAELEEELMNDDYFSKAKVLRNMKKIRRQNSYPPKNTHAKKSIRIG